MSAFEELIVILQRVKNEYERLNEAYKMNLGILERIKQNTPNAKEDFDFIYSEAEQFKTLLPQLSAEIQRYNNDRSFFKSKKQINKCLTALLGYASFFEMTIQHFANIAKELNELEESARQKTALTSMFLNLDELSKGTTITTLRNGVINVLAYTIIQKKSFYVFSKLVLIAYDMIVQLSKTCQPVKTKSILSSNKEYLFLNEWADKYDREMETPYEVSNHIDQHALIGLVKNLKELIRIDAGETLKSPIERYTKENRLKITSNLEQKPIISQKIRNIELSFTNTHNSLPTSFRESEEEKLNAYNQKFQKILIQLKRKTDQLIKKSQQGSIFYDERYEQVGFAAKKLVKALEVAQKEFFCNGLAKVKLSKDKVNAFTQACHNAILEAESEFKKYRHFWDQLDPLLKGLLGVIALITVIPALIVITQSNRGYFGLFFDQKQPNSYVQLKQFEKDFENQIERGLSIS